MKRIHELKTPHLYKWKNLVLGMNKDTMYNAILGIARNFLETGENIKILTNSFYHINLD